MRLIPFSYRDRTSSTRRGRRNPAHRLRPRLEMMEDRMLLSVVTSGADSGPGTLRHALDKAVPGETITFASNLTGTTIHLTSGELAITEPVTIQGPTSGQLTIDAQSHSRVFDITAQGVVTIDNLSIEHGLSTFGGGIYAERGTLILQGDLLAFNQAIETTPGDTASGGAVALGDADLGNAATSLTASNDLFYGNSTSGANGQTGRAGGDAYGGAIYTGLSTTLVVTSDFFYDSIAIGGDGGPGSDGNIGMGQHGGPGGNGGSANGGAIATYGNLSISQSQFYLGTAYGGKGGAGGSGDGGARAARAAWLPVGTSSPSPASRAAPQRQHRALREQSRLRRRWR